MEILKWVKEIKSKEVNCISSGLRYLHVDSYNSYESYEIVSLLEGL